jgi:hypothetical protein
MERQIQLVAGERRSEGGTMKKGGVLRGTKYLILLY